MRDKLFTISLLNKSWQKLVMKNYAWKKIDISSFFSSYSINSLIAQKIKHFLIRFETLSGIEINIPLDSKFINSKFLKHLESA